MSSRGVSVVLINCQISCKNCVTFMTDKAFSEAEHLYNLF